jgi:small subunit ribosomal protein S16
MAVKIRLRRTGGKNDPCFRVVAADATSPRDGRFIEVLGWYDPKQEGKNFELKSERIDHWINHGAIVTTSVKSLLKRGRQAEKAQTA